ncbi:hypothetical protein [Chitinophaga polysaccharea]|uniref:hypothetical protein n=1 Tax=Chitinophaga polysaccharea TaxID=1293035 RepID=UPI0011582C6C|nr:hypothetical protein [Chitinophaga polysaccharea]
MKTKFLLFTVLITVFFFGCKDNPETQELNHDEPSSELKSAIPINKAVANSANPFDFLGEIHNMGLQELFNYTVATGDTTRRGKRQVLRRFFKERFEVTPKGKTNPELEKVILKDYRLVHGSLKMSPLAHSFVENLNKCIDDIKTLNEFKEFKRKFVDIELKISRSSLSRFERECLLKTAAIMRYSAYYWFNFANNNDKAVTMGLLRKIAGIITGIAADGTSALYYAFVSATLFKMLENSIEMSEMCGFYTGGFSY